VEEAILFRLLDNACDEVLSTVENLCDSPGIVALGFQKGALQEQTNFGFVFQEQSILIEEDLDFANRVVLLLQWGSDSVLPVEPDSIEDGGEEGIFAFEVPIDGAFGNAGSVSNIGNGCACESSFGKELEGARHYSLSGRLALFSFCTGREHTERSV